MTSQSRWFQTLRPDMVCCVFAPWLQEISAVLLPLGVKFPGTACLHHPSPAVSILERLLFGAYHFVKLTSGFMVADWAIDHQIAAPCLADHLQGSYYISQLTTQGRSGLLTRVAPSMRILQHILDLQRKGLCARL